MDFDRDAYAVLQVDRRAEFDVIQAAYRALARRYHPDGRCPDAGRMAELNRAYDHLKTPEARRTYDETPRVGVAVGPGRVPVYDPWAAARQRTDSRSDADGSVIDFGRYEGWRIADLARHDPDYLRWLSRHSTGIRYRDAIARSLPGDPYVGRRGSVVG
jgi:curved DNA-binding protein CbpA